MTDAAPNDVSSATEVPAPRVITKRAADTIAGSMALVVGAVILSQAVQSRPGLAQRVDPRTVPVTLSLALVVCGIALVIGALRYKGTKVLEWPTRIGWRRVWLSAAASGLFAAALGTVGLAVAVTVFVGVVEWALDRGSVPKALVWGVGAGLCSTLCFITLLEVQLPAGPIDLAIMNLFKG